MNYPELERHYQILPESSTKGTSASEAKFLYQQVSASTLPMVFGNHTFNHGDANIGIDHSVVANFGTADPSEPRSAKGPLKEVLANLQLPSGTVLGSRQMGRGASEKWSLAANDAWILAGIRSCKDFYLASPLIKTTFFSPTNQFSIRVTGRELCGLLLFGYKLVSRDTGAFAGFIPNSPQRARNADLVAYSNFMDGKTWQELVIFFTEHGIYVG